MESGWEKLAQAIVLRAVEDYRIALKLLRRRSDRKVILGIALEIEDFFNSDWFAQLTDIDPDYLINRLREEANER